MPTIPLTKRQRKVKRLKKRCRKLGIKMPSKEIRNKNLYMKYHLSDQLATVVGSNSGSRPWVLQMLWRYIKGNWLQDEKDKRYIIPNGPLKEIFGNKRFHGFSMSKLIEEHLNPMKEKPEKSKGKKENHCSLCHKDVKKFRQTYEKKKRLPEAMFW